MANEHSPASPAKERQEYNLEGHLNQLRVDLEGPFKKCLQPYIINRTDGNICLNCLAFFSRDSKDFLLHPQTRTTRASTFIKLYCIRSFEDFVEGVWTILLEEGKTALRPSYGRQECIYETNRLQQSVHSLSMQVYHIK